MHRNEQTQNELAQNSKANCSEEMQVTLRMVLYTALSQSLFIWETYEAP